MIFRPVGDHIDGPDISTEYVFTVPEGADLLWLQANGQNLRVTLESTTPTATKGFRVVADEPGIVLTVTRDTTITVIEEAATCDMQAQFGTSKL